MGFVPDGTNASLLYAAHPIRRSLRPPVVRAWSGIAAAVLVLAAEWGFPAARPLAAALRIERPADNVICLGCHGPPGESAVDAAELTRSVHADRTCTDCHRDIRDLPHPAALQEVRCERCHYVRDVITTRRDGQVAKTHLSTHDPAELAGKKNMPKCWDCHGSHEIEPVSSVESRLGRTQTVDTCGACHSRVAADFRRSVHGRPLLAGNPDVPACSYCHREHPRRSNGQQPGVRAAGIVATCVSCHEDPGLQQRYHLPAQRLASYIGSYHGASQQLGDNRVANCASCHGNHNILASSDPRSTVHKANLADTCGHCHPGAGKHFAQGTIHLRPSPSTDPTVFWVQTGAHVFIALLMLAFVSYIGLDLLTRIRMWRLRPDKQPAEDPEEPQVERLSLNQRVQHWILILSFVALVATGMPLLFPETTLSRGVVSFLGGVGARAVIHRIAALLLTGVVVYHVLHTLFAERGNWEFRQLLPRRQDFSNLLHMLRHYFGFGTTRPAFGRYKYIEKFDYWAVGWGSVIMVGSGVLLWSPSLTLAVLPKWVMDVAQVVHGAEAILAFSAIIVWHMYNVHFNPSVFPMNKAWLTGNVSVEEMRKEHPLEYQERYGDVRPPGDIGMPPEEGAAQPAVLAGRGTGDDE